MIKDAIAVPMPVDSVGEHAEYLEAVQMFAHQLVFRWRSTLTAPQRYSIPECGGVMFSRSRYMGRIERPIPPSAEWVLDWCGHVTPVLHFPSAVELLYALVEVGYPPSGKLHDLECRSGDLHYKYDDDCGSIKAAYVMPVQMYSQAHHNATA